MYAQVHSSKYTAVKRYEVSSKCLSRWIQTVVHPHSRKLLTPEWSFNKICNVDEWKT